MLAAVLTDPAVRVTPLGRCRDDCGRLARRLAQMARSYDLLICSGGVSGSDADHVVAATLDAGGACAKLSLALKPGKPLAVGSIGRMAILALPGNPFASLVGALLFARPMLRGLAGGEGPGPRTIVGRTTGSCCCRRRSAAPAPSSADWRRQCVSAGLGPKRVKLL
jgi:molybdopterin molybdotransferase